MQQRSARGIQYEDVARAADALLQEGMRPTIERIRLHIGRGSPNTVSPMLEQWFSGLGKRLGSSGRTQRQMQTSGQSAETQEFAEMPDAVVQLAQTLWEKAFSDAHLQSEQFCAGERARLEVEAQQLHEARMQLQARELTMNERLTAMKAALHSCEAQLAESNAHWQASLRTLAVRDAEIASGKTALEHGRSHAAELQLGITALQKQMLEERKALEERHRASELHWLSEVDRARQEARKSALQAERLERQHRDLQQQADTLQAAQHAKELEQALQTNTLRQELADALEEARQSQRVVEQMHATREALEAEKLQRSASRNQNTATAQESRRVLWTSQRNAVAPVRRALKKSRH